VFASFRQKVSGFNFNVALVAFIEQYLRGARSLRFKP
jgi:hypothetical protein